MDEFIKLLDKDYEFIHYQMKDKAIIFHIQSSRKELTEPVDDVVAKRPVFCYTTGIIF